MTMTPAERKLRKQFLELCGDVECFLAALDAEMKNPSSHERGQRIGKLATALEIANDSAKRFALGMPLGKKIRPREAGR